MASDQVEHVSRTCKNCGAAFTFPKVGRGRARMHCSDDCMKAYGEKRRSERQLPPCSVDGCSKGANRVGAGLCETHYYQLRRNGYLGPKHRPEVIEHTHGYRLLAAPGHPLATPCQQYRIFEHRAVYYDHHGEGPFNCYHCGTVVTWDDMHVDHLNDQPDDNRIENLAASCPPCNVKRGTWKMKRAHRARSRWQITWQGKTQHVGDWADQLGLTVHVLKWRLERWPLERAMTEPVGPTGPKAVHVR